MHSAARDWRAPQRSIGRADSTDRGPRLFAQLAVRLPADVATRLRTFCKRTGSSMNQTVTAAVAQYLDRLEREPNSD
jgi:hypothetical protein